MSEQLAVSARNLVAILNAIIKMSDDVKNASSPMDAQGKLLRMQNSIQRNAVRVVPHVQVVLEALAGKDAP